MTVRDILDEAEYGMQFHKSDAQLKGAEYQYQNYKLAKFLGAEDDDDWCIWEELVEQYKIDNRV